MKLLFLCVTGTFLVCNSYADYPVSDIPDELLENASVIIREEVMDVSVNSFGTQEVYARKVTTIMNESGDGHNNFFAFYDPSSSITIEKCEVYDENGKRIQKFRKSDFEDYAAVSSISLYEDDRVLVLFPVINEYPYTIYYEYTIRDREFMSFPTWFPVTSDEVSVQKSYYRLRVPDDYPVSYYETNLTSGVEKKNSEGELSLEWTLESFLAYQKEPFDPPVSYFLPQVRIVPVNFKLDDYEGSFEDWKSFGKWSYDLIAERDIIPLELRTELANLVEGLENDREKVKRIYSYLQETTRYVSIQLGIGGFQPFSATYVYENGYGDCKALSNYMKAMLKAVGIPSIYTLVRAGKNAPEINTGFPSQQFNHVILCVPLENDTVWLECTSQTNPFGFLGSFTDDRTVLFVEESGGTLARTPAYPAAENCEIRKAEIEVNPDDLSLSAGLSCRYTGIKYNTYASLLQEGREDQARKLKRSLDMTGFTLRDFRIQDLRVEEKPELLMDLELELKLYMTRSGDRIFLPLKLLDRKAYIPGNRKERKRKVHIRLSYEDCDTMIYVIPEDYSIEYIPEEVSVRYDFGYYSASVVQEGNRLVYVRRKGMYEGFYPPDDFDRIVEFYKLVSRSEGMKAMLMKK